ncbi:GntR family transcriptional regulator / MocR family aminotransferase [Pararobbsia alpina]|uniref:MocR-like pyridoxine biosynthesis transcription factor PdxR n=1 Tax=Pararobbsia alpina TaxID=621374 RepID=UPI0039A601AA
MIDLLIELGDNGPMQQRVYEGIYAALRDGRLKPGQRLPASRVWALELGVARNTIREATTALIAEGWLEARAGSGLFVRPQPALHSKVEAALTSARAASGQLSLSAWAGQLPQALPELPSSSLVVDFRPGVVSSDAERLFRYRRPAQSRDAVTAALCQYGDPAGELPLRQRIAAYLRQSRSVRCGPDDIVVTSGMHQSMDLLCRLLLEPGRSLAVEDPGYPVIGHAAKLAGAALCHIGVDDNGLKVDEVPSRIAGVYCTPNHQFPLGVALSGSRRRELLDRAAREDFFVIEDDYDCEFYHGAAPSRCLQAEDAAQRVIYVGSVSKILAPALRIGYIVAPPWLRDSLHRAKWVVDRQTSSYAQNALLAIMSSGDFATHLHRMRFEYGKRRTALLDGIGTRLRQYVVALASTCGMHVAARITNGCDARTLCRLAEAEGVGIYEGNQFSSTGSASDILVFAFGRTGAAEIERGLELIEKAWASRRTADALRGP